MGGQQLKRVRVSLVGTGAACLTVLVPLGSLAGRTECRSRYSRRAPHEPLFRIHGSTPLVLRCAALRCSAPILPPRPVRNSDTRPRWATARQQRRQRASAPLSARQAVHSLRRRCSPSSCACNAAMTGRLCACSVLHIALPILSLSNHRSLRPLMLLRH